MPASEAITVFGFGSLLSEVSARETVPTLSNFRLVRVHGYKRIFNKVSIVLLQRYDIAPDDLHVSSCATRQDGKTEIVCAAFECSEAEFLNLYQREHRYRWVEVDGVADDGSCTRGRMCTEYSDAEYRINKCVTAEVYYERVGRYYSGRIWRDDVLPHPVYLQHCLDAAATQGAGVMDNFLDCSFLGDGVTSIRHYLDAHPDLLHDGLPAYSYRDDPVPGHAV